MEFEVRRYEESDLTQVKKIFFENSSRKSFSNDFEKETFFERWLGVYLKYYVDETFVASTNENQILGYLAGCQNSLKSIKTIGANLASYKVFERQFINYPAHFHINVSLLAQGMGVGKKLIEKYLDSLRIKKIPGAHVVTSQGEPNIDFYKKQKFEIVDREWFKDWELLFMARLL